MVAVLLAGDRSDTDPLLTAAGVSGKSLVPVGGRPMILWVIQALRASRTVGRILLSGPSARVLEHCPELAALVESGDVEWIPPADTPCQSLQGALARIPTAEPVLVTTADHALLKASIVDHFCSQALSGASDLALAVVRHQDVCQTFPETRRTSFSLRDGNWCGCNLFAMLTPRSRSAAVFWRQVETLRKQPLKLAMSIGWLPLLLYVTRRLTLQAAVGTIARRMSLKARAVELPFPQAAVDVDTVEDWNLVRAAWARTAPSSDAGDGFSDLGSEECDGGVMPGVACGAAPRMQEC